MECRRRTRRAGQAPLAQGGQDVRRCGQSAYRRFEPRRSLPCGRGQIPDLYEFRILSKRKTVPRLDGGRKLGYNRTMDTIQTFYRPEDLIRLTNKFKRERVTVWVLAGVTLALCVLFCCLADSRSAARMELAAVLSSTLGGWIVIYRRVFCMNAAKHEREHAEHLLESGHSVLRGRLTVTKERLRIKNSIRIRSLLLENEEGVHRLKVNETQVPVLLKWDGQQVALLLAGSYVAGIGGENADIA